MRPTTQQKDTGAGSPSFEATVEVVADFFSTRLLLKRYRKDKRDETMPSSVVECEQEFEQLVRCAVSLTEAGVELDAVQWADICTTFSTRWNNTCHWVSPRKLRDFFSANAGTKWTRVEAVAPEKEQPAVDLKWYKSLEGSNPITPCMCHLCEVICNSKLQYQAHIQGRTHRTLAKGFLKNGGSAADLVSVPVPPEKLADASRTLTKTISMNSVASTMQMSEACESELLSLTLTSLPSDTALGSSMTLSSTTSKRQLRVHSPYGSSGPSVAAESVPSTSPKPQASSLLCADDEETSDDEYEVDEVASELLATLSFALSMDGTRADEMLDLCKAAVKDGLSPYGTGLVAEAIANAGIRSITEEGLETVSCLCTLVIETGLLDGALESALTTMVTEGFELHFECMEANTEIGFAGALAANKSCGLVKLLGSLVAKGALPDSYLVLLARRIVDAHPHAEAVCTLVQATKTASLSMSESAVSAIRNALDDVVDAGRFSTRVCRLVGSL